MVKLLLDHGAEGRIHPVTRYSPLYIAAYNGRKDVVEVVLKVCAACVLIVCVLGGGGGGVINNNLRYHLKNDDCHISTKLP